VAVEPCEYKCWVRNPNSSIRRDTWRHRTATPPPTSFVSNGESGTERDPTSGRLGLEESADDKNSKRAIIRSIPGNLRSEDDDERNDASSSEESTTSHSPLVATASNAATGSNWPFTWHASSLPMGAGGCSAEPRGMETSSPELVRPTTSNGLDDSSSPDGLVSAFTTTLSIVGGDGDDGGPKEASEKPSSLKAVLSVASRSRTAASDGDSAVPDKSNHSSYAKQDPAVVDCLAFSAIAPSSMLGRLIPSCCLSAVEIAPEPTTTTSLGR
jgi:hypothetical protein